MPQNCNTTAQYQVLFTTNERGGWGQKVLESDWKTSITHYCIINGYIINILTFWRLKLHSNQTSYDNIQIHGNKKNSRFIAKVVTKKSLCSWCSICNNKLKNSIRKTVALNLGIFSSSSFTQDRRVASWINLTDYCTFQLFVNKTSCCAQTRSFHSPFSSRKISEKASCSDCFWQQLNKEADRKVGIYKKVLRLKASVLVWFCLRKGTLCIAKTPVPYLSLEFFC